LRRSSPEIIHSANSTADPRLLSERLFYRLALFATLTVQILIVLHPRILKNLCARSWKKALTSWQ